MREYLHNLGIALDRFLKVLIRGGSPNETLSIDAAKSKKRGEKYGCYFCKWLNFSVERDHCEKALDDNFPTKDDAALRAFLQLLVVFYFLYYIFDIWNEKILNLLFGVFSYY